jgi:hypothetical protein
MKSRAVRITIAMLLACVVSRAQDSHFSPDDQQIPVPKCLSAKDLWLAGSKQCSERNRLGVDLADVPQLHLVLPPRPIA